MEEVRGAIMVVIAVNAFGIYEECARNCEIMLAKQVTEIGTDEITLKIVL